MANSVTEIIHVESDDKERKPTSVLSIPPPPPPPPPPLGVGVEEEEEEGSGTRRGRVSAFANRLIIIRERVVGEVLVSAAEGVVDGEGVELREEEEEEEEEEVTGSPSNVVRRGKRFCAVIFQPFSSSTPEPLRERERRDGMLEGDWEAFRKVEARFSISAKISTAV